MIAEFFFLIVSGELTLIMANYSLKLSRNVLHFIFSVIMYVCVCVRVYVRSCFLVFAHRTFGLLDTLRQL